MSEYGQLEQEVRVRLRKAIEDRNPYESSDWIDRVVNDHVDCVAEYLVNEYIRLQFR